MKFWSRFKHPPPMLAFAFAESLDGEGESLELLTRLPPSAIDDAVVYSLRIGLDESEPRVWRRVLTKAVSLEVLHHVVQLAMGWCDSHLHGFEIRKTRVPLVDDGAPIDESGVSIAQLHAAKIKKLVYTYDFGDDWRHTIVIEKSLPAQINTVYPQCIDGKGACPLEDIGGIVGWSRLLERIRHPDQERDEDVAERVDYLGPDYTPTPFDLDGTNARLQRAFNKRARRTGHA